MGKKDAALNLPENGSLSLTLNSLCTIAEAERTAQTGVTWVPELPKKLVRGLSHLHFPELGERGIERVIRHVERVQRFLPEIFSRHYLKMDDSPQGFLLRTANTFPSGTGIASSASSFAAITLCVAAACSADPSAFEKAYENNVALRRDLAWISRQGSGSSCRSFEGPWVIWEEERSFSLPTAMPEMAHFLILVSSDAKKVSSSDAHSLVKSSPLWKERTLRAENRLTILRAALEKADLKTIARVAWIEAWEMHGLFHTCKEPFSYWLPGTVEALEWLAHALKEEIPPIVTLDAGPNIHVIVPAVLRESWRARFQKRFVTNQIREDQQGNGAGLRRP